MTETRTRSMILALGTIAGIFSASQVSAQVLDAAGIRGAISGKRVFLKTPYGIELPLTYKADGSVSGDVSGFRLASMFAPRETGKWWVADGKLCQQWPTWYDGKRSCFSIERTGATTINWVRDDGTKGTARIAG